MTNLHIAIILVILASSVAAGFIISACIVNDRSGKIDIKPLDDDEC